MNRLTNTRRHLGANKISINTSAWIEASYSKRFLNKSIKRAAILEEERETGRIFTWQVTNTMTSRNLAVE